MTRPARPADRPRLRAIQTVSLAEPWPDLLDTAIEGTGIVRVVTESANSANATDDPVGYAVALPDDDTAYLAEFAVAPAHRREGHGSRLMTDLLAQLRDTGIESVRLTVRMTDRGARAFYESHGFRVRSLLPHHYEDDDGIVLVRSLGESDAR